MKNILSFILAIVQYTLDIIYPRICIICLNALVRGESHICISCLNNLPRTNYHILNKHDLEQRFWGIIPVENVCSFFYFQHEGVRAMIHEIKYRGGESLAVYTGSLYAKELAESGYLNQIDIIIPVPLHSKRLKERGYNQSLRIAEGLSLVCEKPVAEDILIRKIYNPTQTKVSREQRWENVNSIFKLINKDKIKDKHILLVDDVLTTGATLIECAKELQKEPSVKISILTLACVRS
ncbi:MAG: ComF family protein [Bacteroidales bacterium]